MDAHHAFSISITARGDAGFFFALYYAYVSRLALQAQEIDPQGLLVVVRQALLTFKPLLYRLTVK